MKIIKNIVRCLLLSTTVVIMVAPTAHSQYYEIASQLPGLISPALSGSMQYRGFVDAYGLAGLGNNRANIVGISTSQGFQYADWFFMGVGVGVEAVMARNNDALADPGPGWNNNYYYHSFDNNKAMIPVFTDFRFNIGGMTSTSFFIDLKVGAAWLLGDNYLGLNNRYISTATQFYLRPSLGVRIPIESKNCKHAVDIGLTYGLLTSNNNYGWYGSGSASLSNLGVTISYEW